MFCYTGGKFNPLTFWVMHKSVSTQDKKELVQALISKGPLQSSHMKIMIKIYVNYITLFFLFIITITRPKNIN